MITDLGIVVPARNEQDSIIACLDALEASRAALRSTYPLVRSRIVLVLDTCTDSTADLASGYRDVEVVTVEHGSVGAARATGTARAVHGVASSDDHVWLANTDADSIVPADWLTKMITHADQGAEVVLGTVRPDLELDLRLRRLWDTQHCAVDGHPHVHGANFGIRLDVYKALGGWSVTRTGEDVELAGKALGRFVIHRAADLAVTTSSRTAGRAPEGFADYLLALAQSDDLAPTA